MTETSGRLLKLLSLLQTRRDWPGNELAQRLDVSGRTIRRDVERLRELGYPVDALTGPAGGYRLHAGTAMPPLLLDDDEAVAIAVGLRTAAGASVAGIEETSVRALVKLEQVLPSHLRRRVNALGSALATLPASGPMVDPAGAHDDRRAPAATASACASPTAAARRRTAAASSSRTASSTSAGAGTSSRGTASARTGAPSASTASSAPRRPGTRFEPRALPGGEPGGLRRRRACATRPSRYQARVTLHARGRRAAELAAYLWGTVEAAGADRCEYATSDDSLDWLAMRIGMLGFDFEVHEPPELVERFAELAARFGRAARPRG